MAWVGRLHNSSLCSVRMKELEISSLSFPLGKKKKSYYIHRRPQFSWGCPKKWHMAHPSQSTDGSSAIWLPGGKQRQWFQLIDTITSSLDSKSEWTITTAVCFSLRREIIGLVIKFHNFFRHCTKDRLLTCVSQSAEDLA